MFERLTQGARRAVFFSRDEASRFGNAVIGAEHLLLGVLREERGLPAGLSGQFGTESDLVNEVEGALKKGPPIPTSNQMPLSEESKKALNFAIEAADKLGHRPVDTMHLIAGLLSVESSLASHVLAARGMHIAAVLDAIARCPVSEADLQTPSDASLALGKFLSGLQSLNAKELLYFFADSAEMTDPAGMRWAYKEMSKEFGALFTPYAKKNATFILEKTLCDNTESFVATVLWKNALMASEERAWMHRMTVAMVPKENDWKITSIHVLAIH
jgi:ClpA/ClpB-like protein